MRRLKITLLVLGVVFFSAAFADTKQSITIVTPINSPVRVSFGASKLTKALTAIGYKVNNAHQLPASGRTIVVGITGNDILLKAVKAWHLPMKKIAFHKEGFSISSSAQNNIVIEGLDNSGALYGCIEVADEIKDKGQLPNQISKTDHPEMVLRGACIGMQKPTYLPGRGVYEYPYTPETFPWFYDKAMWVKYLDQMVDNRMNSLYLWNGHPFASLVRLKEYPFAVEVSDETFKKNEEIFKFLTQEADKRGIWIIQMFYNIYVSKPFAEHYNIKTQDRNRPIVPLIADYTRKSIAAFVQKYPNVGLMVCLGEAMEGVGNDDVEWFTKTIVPGVKDGLKALGKTEEPPIVLRAHDTDAPNVMKYALPLYKNLYTEAKYTGEALTTYTPRGPWAELHRTLSHLGSVQIENIHIMANLEPFRYGSADFIQKCVLAMHNTYEANGLHIYPQASYWDWPYTADKAGTRLLQMDRDWIWYKEWARYSWNCHRDREAEKVYWDKQLAEKYACDTKSSANILEAYEQSGEIAPKLLRRFGITDGNRQTLTLGMFMSQLVNPERYGLFTLLYNSEGPEGEALAEYAEKEFKHQPHVGETPVTVINDVIAEGKAAVAAINAAGSGVKADKAEFKRLKNDMYCYNELANFYADKAQAALLVLNYKYSNNLADLQKAIPYLQSSVNHFKKLSNLTSDTYLYANSMQTGQRKIPIGGNDGKNKTWVELLPKYEQELKTFTKNVDSLKLHQGEKSDVKEQVLTPANVTWLSKNEDNYTLANKTSIYADTNLIANVYDGILKDLKGIRLSKKEQIASGTTLKFTTNKPVKLLVGFFKEKGKNYSAEPTLENDASANDYGQAEIKIGNAIVFTDMPAVNIHAYSFAAGTHTLTLAKGECLVLGFIDANTTLPVYDAAMNKGGANRKIDALFN
ncbi:MAG: hypothetical protein ABIN91_04775 [Mucilaginibacter sp.]|uniref:alpha-d-galacturonidase n=1 Tax=Mucilaginibacter sp. TaxID=1882438 RepID=UPI003264E3DC